MNKIKIDLSDYYNTNESFAEIEIKLNKNTTVIFPYAQLIDTCYNVQYNTDMCFDKNGNPLRKFNTNKIECVKGHFCFIPMIKDGILYKEIKEVRE